jgi:hypothetical protein
MIEVTLGYLDTHVEKWQSIAKIGEVRNELELKKEAIDDAAKAQLEAAVAPGKMKLELKRTMSKKADILNDIVEVYGVMNFDDQLVQKMSDSYSTLYAMKYEDFFLKVKQIIEQAEANKQTLIDEYGMTEEQIISLQNDYDNMMELSGQPREYRIKSKVATQNLDELFSDAAQILDQKLDNLMKLFKRRDPNFYSGYEKARMVVDFT